MSPHGLVLIAALLLAGTGKLALPGSTLRIVAALVLGLPLALALALGERPSLLGILMVAPLVLAGAVIGIAGAGFLRHLWSGMRRQR
jgi:ABC-type molybdate transport system permease subunit